MPNPYAINPRANMPSPQPHTLTRQGVRNLDGPGTNRRQYPSLPACRHRWRPVYTRDVLTGYHCPSCDGHQSTSQR